MVDVLPRLTAALADRYRIEREIGAGGMATVYLAQDIKHDRKVALKVLKPELAAVLGAERFVVEIKTTAALQHPHILPLFDSGEAGGFLYYVMPFIDGETLRAKLDRETQLGVDEAVRIATDVGSALHYAHTHGVIHRDIKPENILLHDGRPMVADFGIALAVSAAAGGRMTETGLSLGTPHYMSPEQATAEKEITARSDVYSLGSVLYEMLAGQPPHLGGSAQQIIMKIIAETPQVVTALRKSVPPNVAAAVAKALEKLPADRFETAKAFAEALGNSAFLPAHTSVARSHVAATGWRRALLPIVAMAAGGAGFMIATALRAGDGAPGPSARFIVTAAPASALLPNPSNSDLAISPDGRLVAYVVAPSRAIYVRAVDSLAGRILPGTEGAASLVFSPDGNWIAFGSQGILRKVPATGGSVIQLAKLGGTLGTSWGANDSIVMSTYVNLFSVPAEGGVAIPLMKVDSASVVWRRFPEVLPGGGIIYTGRAEDGSSRLAVFDRRTGTDRLLPQIGSYPRWSPTGHVIYNADNALWALPFDPRRLVATGAPVLVQQDVASKTSGASNFAIARDAGTLVYATAGTALTSTVWIDTLGNVSPMEGVAPGLYRDPKFSPDRSMLALISGAHLFTYDIRRATLSQITRDSVDNYSPVWMTDGKSIAFASTRGGARRLYLRRADGSGSDQELLTARAGLVDFRPMAITPDGSSLLVTRVPVDLKCWIGLVELSSARDNDSANVVRNSLCNDMPALSPDGHWLAYNAGSVVMVERFPEGGMRQQLSGRAGQFPLWSRDGGIAYYQAGDSMMAVSIQAAGALSFGKPRLLFRADFMRYGSGRQNFDLGPAGRFAVVLNTAPGGNSGAGTSGLLPGTVVLVQDWTGELKRIMAKK